MGPYPIYTNYLTRKLSTVYLKLPGRVDIFNFCIGHFIRCPNQYSLQDNHPLLLGRVLCSVTTVSASSLLCPLARAREFPRSLNTSIYLFYFVFRVRNERATTKFSSSLPAVEGFSWNVQYNSTPTSFPLLFLQFLFSIFNLIKKNHL